MEKRSYVFRTVHFDHQIVHTILGPNNLCYMLNQITHDFLIVKGAYILNMSTYLLHLILVNGFRVSRMS